MFYDDFLVNTEAKVCPMG